MRHAATQALYAYWNEIRGQRAAPRRLEIEPARIGDLLLDTFILERNGPVSFRFRLMGTRVSLRFGLDLRSQDFLACWSEGDRSMLEHHLSAITDLGRAGLFTGEAIIGSDAPALAVPCTFEMLILPLAHTSDAIDRLLCIIVPLDGELPPKARIEGLRLSAAESIWPQGISDPDQFADRQLPLHPLVRKARIVRQGRRQFRVYEGGLTTTETR